MHRGLAEASEHTSTVNRAPTSLSSTAQHGLDRPLSGVAPDDVRRSDDQHRHPDSRDSAALPRSGAGHVSTPGSVAAGADKRVVDVQKLDEKLRRLSGRAAQSSSSNTKKASPAGAAVAGQRISEYERALTAAALKRERVVFQVIKKPSGSTSKGRSLNDFPNEVLTHIFSYLQPGSHDSVALVSKRFYSLITTPHAWRMAFLRFFPGQEAAALRGTPEPEDEPSRSSARLFSRLTPLASWRSEYLLRTRLLRSLMSGRPGASVGVKGDGSGSNKSASHSRKATAVITYNSQLLGIVNQLQASFPSTGKKSPRVVHGSSGFGVVTSSNPTIGKLEGWGFREAYLAPQLEDVGRQLTPYGMGDGHAAVPNVMDVSHIYGAIVGEGFPGGRPLYRAMGDRTLAYLETTPRDRITESERDIPCVLESAEAVCSVWIAKSPAVPSMTKSMIGTLVGTSLGIVSAYSLGKADSASRYPYSHVTARWVLSPGVPIVAIKADDSYTEKRKAGRRIWAVALNALGEVYYLQDIPTTPTVAASLTFGQRPSDVHEKLAWAAGHTASWELVGSTRRVVTSDWFDDKVASLKLAASHSPRFSPGAMKSTLEERAGEAREIEKFFLMMPFHFRAVYDTWDMRRRLEVDFAGGSSSINPNSEGFDGTGENIIVISSGEEQDGQRKAQPAKVTRYTRLVAAASTASRSDTPASGTPTTPSSPLFPETRTPDSTPIFSLLPGSEQSASAPSTPATSRVGDKTPRLNAAMATVGWQTTIFSLLGNGSSHGKSKPNTEITCSALDLSMSSLLAPFEDPLLQSDEARSFSIGNEIPGRRARWAAVGTKTGAVIVWNMRQQTSSSTDVVWPLRIIHTDSPEISSLAVSSLYLAHGGSDGLVQAWDPLASTMGPIRTLNSPTSGRVPRHLQHLRAQLSSESFSAVGAIFLDPDPTVLRGVLSVGTFLRYWSYSSAIHSNSRKRSRRLRHTNVDGQLASRRLGDKVSDYIAAETAELRREQERDSRHRTRMLNRFGVGLAGLSEEEAVRYAEIMSEETFLDEQRRSSGNSDNSSSSDPASFSDASASASVSVSGLSVDTVTPEPSMSGRSPPGGGFISSGTSPAPASVARSPGSRRVSHGGLGTGNEGRGGHAASAADEDDFELQIQRAIRLSLMEGVNEEDGSGPTSSQSPSGIDLDFPVTYRPTKREDGKRKMSNSSAFAPLSSSPEASQGARNATAAYTGKAATAARKASSSSAAAAGPSSSSAVQTLLDHHMVGDNEEDDFQLALRLSLQDEEARLQQTRGGGHGHDVDAQEQYANDAALAALLQDDEFPALEVKGKGKGKGKGL